MAAITEPVPASAKQINDDILRVLEPPSILYVLGVGALVAMVLAGVGALAWQTYAGFGVTGLMHPVMWGGLLGRDRPRRNPDLGDPLPLPCQVAERHQP
jgi:hypothetical protein